MVVVYIYVEIQILVGVKYSKNLADKWGKKGRNNLIT